MICDGVVQYFCRFISVITFSVFYCLSIQVNAQSVILIDETLHDGDVPSGWSANEIDFRILANDNGYALFETNSSTLETAILDFTDLSDILLSFDVAKYGQGEDGPVTVEISDDGGATWEVYRFDSPVPVNSTYLTSGPTVLRADGDNVRLRFTRAGSPSQKRIRNIKLTAISESRDPAIYADPTLLTDFEYSVNSGPSAVQAFMVSGYNLAPPSGELIVSGAGNYEVATENTYFSDSQTIFYSNGYLEGEYLYVRIKEGLPAGDYDEILLVTGGEADAAYVNLSGAVKITSIDMTSDIYEQNFNDFTGLETIPDGWTFDGDRTYRGAFNSSVTTSGIYGEGALGFQLVTSGENRYFSTALELVNETGKLIENLSISYLGKVERTDATRMPAWSVFLDGNDLPELDYSTADEVDETMSTVVTGLQIEEGEAFKLEWVTQSATGSGSNRKIGISDIRVEVSDESPPPAVNASVEPGSLFGLEYAPGSGPSSSKFTVLNGSNLSPDSDQITVTASDNVEISLDDELFSSSLAVDYQNGTISEQTVYVRLKAGLTAGDYTNEEISVSGGGADWKPVGVSGWVSAPLATAAIPYNQDFRDFVSYETLPKGWVVSDSSFAGEWGSGSGAGLRGSADVLGYQHTGSTGVFTATLVLENTTGSLIENINVSYLGRVERSTLGRHPAWSVEVNGHAADALCYSTSGGVDTWFQTSIPNLSIGAGETFTVTWSSDRGIDGSGSSRQIGISDVSVSAFAGELVYETRLSGSQGFRMLSPPVQASYRDLLAPVWTQGMLNANTPDGDPNVWTWDHSSSDGEAANWIPLQDLNAPAVPGNGFLAYVFEKDGESGSDAFPKVLSVSGGVSLPVSSSVNENQGGFTLAGNPTGSPLAWDNMITTDLDDVVYIWDANEGESGDWKSWGNGAGDLTGGIIRPYQAFFTRTSGGSGTPSLKITEDALSTGGNYYGKQVSREQPALMRLQIEGENLRNSTWLHFSNNGKLAKDRGDGLKLQPFLSDYALLATQSENNLLLDINHLPLSNNLPALPLHISATRSGTYALSATQMNLPHDWTVTLTDNQTGKSVVMDTLTSYEFEIASATANKQKVSSALIKQAKLTAGSSAMSERFMLTINSGTVTGAELFDRQLPLAVALHQNHPNPFNPTTSIGYELPEAAYVHLAIYDVMGREISVLVSETKPAGIHQVTWDAQGVSSGIYLYRLVAGGKVMNGKMTLIK
ncbi:MAG: T9SS type A sorting domain-containing protein [Balneolales bacterium]